MIKSVFHRGEMAHWCLQPWRNVHVHKDLPWWWHRLRTNSAGTCTRSWGRRTARTWSCPPSACPLLLLWSHLGPRVWLFHRLLFVFSVNILKDNISRLKKRYLCHLLRTPFPDTGFPKTNWEPCWNISSIFALRCLLPQLHSNSKLALDTANKIFLTKGFPKPKIRSRIHSWI